jgi:hypothetical protein
MNFDLRFPIGLLFSFYGLLLVCFGIFTRDSQELYKKSLDLNINFDWGVVLLLFGAAMLVMALRARRAAAQNKPPNQPPTETKIPTSTTV